MVHEPVAQVLHHRGGHVADPVHPLDGSERQAEAVQAVQDRHVERRGGGALLHEPVDVEALGGRAAVQHAVHQPGIAVEGEDHRAVASEQAVEHAR